MALNKAQKQAAEQIVKQFLEYIQTRGEVPKETYRSPMSNKIERNGVTVDVRQLKILAGLEVDKD